MGSTALDTELDVWQAAGYGVRIDYSRAVMEELRLAATSGFNRLAHGGVEIGGVLFGVHDPDAVKILAHKPLACEYAFGPSFTLWDNDRRALELLLASPDTDSSLAGMQPVGWYHSHTRSEILLSEKDLQLYQQYFPEIWQIALVLRPYRFDPVRAGFFFREPDGSIHAASSRHEFVIKPAGGNPALPEPLPLESGSHEPGSHEPGSHNEAPYPPPPAISRNPPGEPEPRPSPPPAASSYPRRRWARSATMTAAAVAVVLAGLLFSIGRSRASADLLLRAIDAGGQLRIDWNHNSRVILESESGALEIEDGSLKVHDELSHEHLRAGTITYLRTTGDVLVRLLVRGAHQSTFTETSRFVGPPILGTQMATAPAARVPRDVEPRVQSKVQPVLPEPPSNPTPRPLLIQHETAHQGAAASTPARPQFVLPPPDVPRPDVPHMAEPLLPAPPMIAANTAAPVATFIPRLPAPATPKPADQGPSTGKIIWTGKLTRSGTIQILGNRASQGHLTGGLPGAPVRVRVFPSELTPEGLSIFTADPRSISAREAPGAQNGWNRTVYVLNPKKAGEIRILEAPGQQNAWNRITLRAERGDHSIMVLLWERVPAESAHSAAGDQ